MDITGLRIALFSGNYNYVRDGANQALNQLVGYLLRQGAKVRVYSPVVPRPAFPPTGDLVGTPSLAIPGRSEYRVPYRMSGAVRRDIERFAPNIVRSEEHTSELQSLMRISYAVFCWKKKKQQKKKNQRISYQFIDHR